MSNNPAPIPPSTFATAPLVALVEADPSKMSREELENYLSSIRAMRASPATARAKTERAPRKSSQVNQSLVDDL